MVKTAKATVIVSAPVDADLHLAARRKMLEDGTNMRMLLQLAVEKYVKGEFVIEKPESSE